MAYTTIDDPSEYFQTTLYTGDGSSSQAQTNAGNSDLQPDWVWIKKRAGGSARSHQLYDSTRGVTKLLHSDANNAEQTQSAGLTAFSSDGFTVGDDDGIGANTATYVAWQWKANAGTTTTISAGGDIGRETVSQVNTTAGFNICTYTGSGSGSSFGHSLGAIPHWIIIKNRSQADDWFVWVRGLNNNVGLDLNTNTALQTTNGFMNNEAPTSTFVGLGDGHNTNASGENYIAYLFTEKQGFSKFGSYTGNGNVDGPFVYTGFKPAWVMIKRTDNGGDWAMMDNKRPNEFNVVQNYLKAQESEAENSDDSFNIDILSNGIKVRYTNGNYNADGGSYIYMAFAESPFVSSKGVPTTAR